MTDLLTALSDFFSAGTPDQHAKTMAALVAAYREAQAARRGDPATLTIPVVTLAGIDRLAGKAGLDSAEALLDRLATDGILQQHIIANLNNTTTAPRDLPDAVIRPPEPVTESIARISTGRNCVKVILPEKHDGFRDLVKAQEYQWDENESCWVRNLGIRSGTVIDRAAELGVDLLRAGFIITADETIRERVLTGNYKPEIRRWILRSDGKQYPGWFRIWWRREEDCYAAAMKITGARYCKPDVVAPPEVFDEVLDFAEMHRFTMSDEAQAVVEAARCLRANAYIFGGEQPHQPALNGTGEIDDDLADDL